MLSGPEESKGPVLFCPCGGIKINPQRQQEPWAGAVLLRDLANSFSRLCHCVPLCRLQ